jgi:hypothetical protein
LVSQTPNSLDTPPFENRKVWVASFVVVHTMKGWPSLTFENGKGCGSLIRGGKPTMKVGPNCIGKAKGPSSVTKRRTVEISHWTARVGEKTFFPPFNFRSAKIPAQAELELAL